MTVEEFDKIPDPPGARLELRHGVPVPVTFPKWDHEDLQHQLVRLLERSFPDKAVRAEMAFRPQREHELWGADVGVVSRERRRASRPLGWLKGSPEIVVEIISPSNNADELADREKTCFDGGAEQFWIVYSKSRHVRVSFPDGRGIRYEVGQKIPAGDSYIDVAEIFSVLD